MTFGADPIAVATSLISAQAGQPVDSFVIRKEAKGHGTQSRVEKTCACMIGARVHIVEDVVTSGASTLKAIEAAQRAGLVPIGIVALVDREEGGRAALAATGIAFAAIFSRRDFDHARLPEVTTSAVEYMPAVADARPAPNKSRLIVALDVPGAAEAMQLARMLRKHVSMVKLGLESFVAHGPTLGRQMRSEGIDVF